MFGRTRVISSQGDADVVRVGRVTPDFFGVFKAAPIRGRDFTAAEDLPGGPSAIIVSYGLCNCVAERPRVRTNAIVAADDRHELRRLAEELHGRQVHGVERANRFNGKRTSRSDEHVARNCHDRASTLEHSQRAQRLAFFVGCDATSHSSADQRARGFRKRERRSHPLAERSQIIDRLLVLFEQRGQ